MEETIFSFDDFLQGKNPKTKERIIEEVIPKEEIKPIFENTEIEEEVEEQIEEQEEISEEVIEDIVENFYPLFKDKSENFSCDIYVEGAKTDDTITRLIVESDEWTLMFPGEIKNGKVNIPIRKLSLFEEGQKGKVRLEVIADGSVFIPWEDTFKVKVSKKVTVSLNENKKVVKKPELGVKVNIKR